MKIREALFRILLGTHVVGVKLGEKENLMTAAWLTPVASEPPCIAVAVSSKHLTAEMMERSGKFTVSVLAKDQYGTAYRCGTVSGRDADKTATEAIAHDAAGTPMLAEAAARLSCRVHNIVRLSDHLLFIGEVVDALASDQESMPYDMKEILSRGKQQP